MGRNGLRNALTLLLCFAAAFAFSQRPPRGGFDARGGPPRPGFGQDIPADWPPILQRAFKSAFQLKYSGTRVVIFRRGPERRKTTEYILKDGPRLRIEYPDDSMNAGQVIVENGRERQHFFPEVNEIHIGPAMHDDAFEKLRMFLRPGGRFPVKIALGQAEAVAGQRAGLVLLNDPRGNTIQRLWIDERTGLILKRELYDPVGAVVGSFEFTKVNYGPVIRREDFKIVRRGAQVITPEDKARRLMRENDMVQAFLPEDKYRKLMSSRILSRVAASKVLILTYEAGHGKPPLSLVQVEGQLDRNRLNRLAGPQLRTYTWTLSGRTFALMGDLTEDEIRGLAARVAVR